jgi:hypothetical protein
VRYTLHTWRAGRWRTAERFVVATGYIRFGKVGPTFGIVAEKKLFAIGIPDASFSDPGTGSSKRNIGYLPTVETDKGPWLVEHIWAEIFTRMKDDCIVWLATTNRRLNTRERALNCSVC